MYRICFVLMVVWVAAMTISSKSGLGQRPGINQDESKVPSFTLPDPLVCTDGSLIDSSADWETKRRPEVLQLFADHVYGNFPVTKVPVSFQSKREPWKTLDGSAVRREVQMIIGGPDNPVIATVLLTLPVSDKPVPIFVGYNFNGNHTTTTDPRVSLPTSWVRNNKSIGAQKNQASEQGRGTSSSRWPYEEIIKHGYGVATIYYGDIDPDFDDGFENGIHPLFFADGQTKPSQKQWGSIGAWAWGLSRAVDFFETDPAVDANRIAVIGHSRLGKTSLWAGASDPRFAMVVSNDSGCGGAALSRRKFGETVKAINQNFPHWFCDQFVDYDDNENALPVDQHMLIALMAPRPVYVASASEDLWADPKGEFLSLANADGVYALYGNEVMTREMPKPDAPVFNGPMGYHLRTGKHDISRYDWLQYIEFADRNLKTGTADKQDQ